MQLTATTTDEQILEPVKHAREALVRAATEDKRAEELAGSLNSVAYAEGEAYARARFRDLLAQGHHGAPMREALLKLLLPGVDDTWSGRKNDVRRARFEGLQRAVNDLIWTVPPTPSTEV